MLTRKTLTGASLLCLTILSGCSTAPIKTESVTIYKPQYISLPAELTTPVPVPEHKIMVNSDLTDYIIMLKTALRKANSQLQAIKDAQP